MARIVTVEQMRAIESEADRRGITYERMMDRAGREVFACVAGRCGPVPGKRVVVLCGGGNNGGDGLVAAVHFAQAGAAVTVILAARRKEGDPRLRAAAEAGCAVEDATEEPGRSGALGRIRTADVFVDAVLGTGTSLPLRAPAADVLATAGRMLAGPGPRPFVAAVDCPSGVDCDTGRAAPETIPADLTVTLGAGKRGLLIFPAAEFAGSLVVADIGLPRDLSSLDVPGPLLADPEMVREWLPRRPRDSHKGTFGRVIVVGGSVHYPGAPALAGLGAYRAGAGLVTLAVPRPVHPAAVPLLPEATWIVLPDDLGVIAPGAMEVLEPEIESAQALVFGPGLGREKPTAAFVRNFFVRDGGRKSPLGFGGMEKREGARKPVRPPMVIDADGLRLMADDPGWPERIPPGSVLTPHPGEMSALTGRSREQIQNDRPGTAIRYAREWNATVVLKGAFTVAAAPDGRCAISPFATPALARAGTGDVLAGVIGGLIAQGVDGWPAAVLGAYLHGRAGELAAARLGDPASVLAGDVALSLADAIAEIRG